MPARLTVLSGPSGVGKGTVVNELRQIVPDVWMSVSATTRLPRPGEREGREYFFVTPERFAQMVEAAELLEYAEFAGNWYGTPRAPVTEHLERGTPTLLEIELHGARQVKAAMPDAHFVFLAPPSVEALVQRLERRGTETSIQRAARIARAEIEMAAEHEFDVVVVNDQVPRAAAEIAALLTSAR